MKKGLSLIAIMLFAASMVQAGPVDVETAKQMATKFMMANAKAKSTRSELVHSLKTAQGEDVCYVFSVDPKGFVIVSADDRMKPILGYSTESNFTEMVPDGLMTFFDNYKVGFEQMVANDDLRTERAVADWNSVAETGRLSGVRSDREISPLLASIWNQTDLYNALCPEDPTSVFGGRCKSGCVANAMSQIMRYWEWPRHGEGAHSYDASGYYGGYGIQSADFSAATYHYELMPDFLDFASPQAEVDATALLEYHAGISVDMGYGPSASGAFSEDVGPAYLNYFRYADDLNYHYENGYDEWRDELRYSLEAGMPLYYAASGPDGGHAFVCDGYDEYDFFHFNWGWQGFDNGYFDVEAFYLTYYSFNWWHSAIFNLHPVDAYYQAPKSVDNLEAFVDDARDGVVVRFNPVYQKRDGGTLTQLDTVVIMRDGVVIDALTAVTDDEIEYHDETLPKNGMYYYTVYAVNEAGMSKVARDTVMYGNTCDLRFELHDIGEDGWDMSFIAVLDEDGKVSQRVGLWDGGEASVVVPVPSEQTATLFWTYDNTCYSHGLLTEASYEVYDWDDNLIVASDGYPVVGAIKEYEINCGHVAVPESQEDPEEEFVHVTVYNIMGQLIYQGSPSSMRSDHWKPGVYLLRYSTKDGKTVTKKMSSAYSGK